MVKDCCKSNVNDKKCVRKSDGKIFNLPRKFSKNSCKNVKGFSMRSSCAPYNGCFIGVRNSKRKSKNKKTFLYNPDNPKKSFDVYIDKNPKDTIPIKYTTIQDVKNTIKKLEKLYNDDKYTHKRIWQVGMIMKVRLETIKKYHKTKYPNAKNVNERFNLANRYFKFLGKRTKTPKDRRKKLIFNY